MERSPEAKGRESVDTSSHCQREFLQISTTTAGNCELSIADNAANTKTHVKLHSEILLIRYRPHLRGSRAEQEAAKKECVESQEME